MEIALYLHAFATLCNRVESTEGQRALAYRYQHKCRQAKPSMCLNKLASFTVTAYMHVVTYVMKLAKREKKKKKSKK